MTTQGGRVTPRGSCDHTGRSCDGPGGKTPLPCFNHNSQDTGIASLPVTLPSRCVVSCSASVCAPWTTHRQGMHCGCSRPRLPSCSASAAPTTHEATTALAQPVAHRQSWGEVATWHGDARPRTASARLLGAHALPSPSTLPVVGPHSRASVHTHRDPQAFRACECRYSHLGSGRTR